jgi:endo-1,4-beta-xylanase
MSRILVLITTFLLVFFSFAPREKGLKDYYATYFPIGVAVNPRMVQPGPDADLIKAQFNSLTPENAMKMGPIHPEENRYFWKDADAIMAFAEQNKLKVRGHTLCWHNQTPRWFFTDSTGKQVSREVLLARMKKHISEVVGRYKGKIYAWDVVNEAVPDGGTDIYRKSKFYEIIGDDYIEKAFQFAHEADPEAVLFYNDYNTENASKRERIYQLVKKLKGKAIPINGVGLQGHWSLDEPTAQELEESITKFANLGLTVQITELDVSVYPKEHERREKRDTDKSEFTPGMNDKQAAHYKLLFDVFRKHKDKISGVTFWNLSDKQSWLDNFPVPGRKDFPLLFDQNYQPKKAFQAVVTF